MLSTVLLSIKGDARKTTLSLSEDGSLPMETIKTYFKKKDLPEIVYQYEEEDYQLVVVGYKKGKKGTENKTELPVAGQPLFGDAIVVAYPHEHPDQPTHYTVDQWNNFCSKEEIPSESEEEEEVEEIESEDEVKDEFESDSEESLIEEEEEVPVPVVKRRRAPLAAKVDTAALKEKIPSDTEADSHPIRVKSLAGLAFLQSHFTQDEICVLEKAIFQAAYQYAEKQYIAQNWKTPLFCEAYRQRYHTVVCNLHPRSPVRNERLLSRIKDGEFPLEELPFMSSYEMYPEKWFQLKDKLLQREQKILEGNKSRATDQFKCRRCQKRECTYYELQTRSADEPMTIFITCLNCGKEWRLGG